MKRTAFEASGLTLLNGYKLKLQQRERSKGKKAGKIRWQVCSWSHVPPQLFSSCQLSSDKHQYWPACSRPTTASDEERIYISRSQIYRFPPPLHWNKSAFHSVSQISCSSRVELGGVQPSVSDASLSLSFSLSLSLFLPLHWMYLSLLP